MNHNIIQYKQLMTFEQGLFLLVLIILGIINFQSIVESIFNSPQKTYTLALLYDSKKSQSKSNISLYESFAIQFLHRSENKLQFLELLNFEEYKINVQQLFMKVLPITQIVMLPWKLNYTNIESLVISLDYSLVNNKYKTFISMYQFDQTQEVGFTPYYSLSIEGKPIQILKNNDSVHLQVISKDSLQLISVLPNLIFKQNSIISRHKFNPSIEILCWDESINHLAYIQNDDPTVLHLINKFQNESTTELVKIQSLILNGDIVIRPLKISLLEKNNETKMMIILLTLRKSSISLRYIQFNKFGNTWQQYKNGVLSNDVGINPKEFQKLSQSVTPIHYYQPDLDIYIIFIGKLYFIDLRATVDKHYHIDMSLIQITKIVSFDGQYRLLLKYNIISNKQDSILLIILLNEDFSQRLRQQIGVFEQCYDITFQSRDSQMFLFVGTELEYLDVYNLIEHDNPSILKSSAQKLLCAYAFFKFSKTNIIDYFNIF